MAKRTARPPTVRAEEPKPPGQPFVAEYYYTARWGHADEFIRLFKKNHLPVLKKQIETGRILRVSAVKPRYHATEDWRWDYRVTIVFKDEGNKTRMLFRQSPFQSDAECHGHGLGWNSSLDRMDDYILEMR